MLINWLCMWWPSNWATITITIKLVKKVGSNPPFIHLDIIYIRSLSKRQTWWIICEIGYLVECGLKCRRSTDVTTLMMDAFLLNTTWRFASKHRTCSTGKETLVGFSCVMFFILVQYVGAQCTTRGQQYNTIDEYLHHSEIHIKCTWRSIQLSVHSHHLVYPDSLPQCQFLMNVQFN